MKGLPPDVQSNIMSLGGIAIAIGAMVDAVIIMIENAHKHLEHDPGKKPHWDIIRDAIARYGLRVGDVQDVLDGVARGTIKLPSGYNIFWSGQYEYMLRAQQRLMIVVPLTLLIIILIIYLNTRSAIKTAIVMLAVPFSLVGAFAVLHWLGYNLSVAVWVGIIALAGLDAETGVVMLLYLDLAYAQWFGKGQMRNVTDLRDAIYHGAVKRVRPKAMTASVIIAGLLPILWSHGAGADVMKRIATPMIGGVITSTIMELLVYPATFYVWRSRQFGRAPARTET